MTLTNNQRAKKLSIPWVQITILGVSASIFVFGKIAHSSIQESTNRQQTTLNYQIRSLEKDKSNLKQKLDTKKKLNKLYSALSKNNYSIAYTYYITENLPKQNTSKILTKLDKHCRTPLFAKKTYNMIVPSDLYYVFVTDNILDDFLKKAAEHYCQ